MDDLHTSPQDSLTTLAERIAQYAREADDRTLMAALLVREARARVENGEAGEVTWYEWAPQNIKLSESRLRELQRIAGTEDPQREIERIRAQTQRRVAKHREGRKAAALRNAATDRLAAEELDPARERLIEFAQTADLVLIGRVWTFAAELRAAGARPEAAERVGG